MFDGEFFDDALVTEDRYDATEVLGDVADIERMPSAEEVGACDPEGYGEPGERTLAAIADDLIDGKTTRGYVKRAYGSAVLEQIDNTEYNGGNLK